MSNYARYRDWHMWIGLVLLIPLSVIATTGFLWNHEKSLGIKPEIGHERTHEKTSANNDAAASLVSSPGAWNAHSQSIDAALAAARQQWGQDVPLERIELKDEPGLGLVVKVKAPEESGVRPYEIVWSANSETILERKGDPQAGTDWAKVVHDLHTGKFFSKRFGFIWSDSSALAILALSFTGLILYLIPVLKKRAKRKSSPIIKRAVGPAHSQTVVRSAAPVLSAEVDDGQR